MFEKVDPKTSFPKMEEEIIVFWEKNKIFEKSLEIRKDAPLYTFYDGPPFATGTPHYGHLVASTMKDVVPRYWTMKGFLVERKWGWDCHGLPIENIVEKELGSKTKKDIEKIGVEKFNELCRSKVLKYVEEWKKSIKRFGRWADMENSYKTMDLPFMESVWWVFKELYDKGYIYEGYRSMHICPRCETTLSQSEVAEGYKDIKDLSATVKFEITNYEFNTKYENTKNERTYILAWTTTPWTLIGNVALAVGEKIEYVKVKFENDNYILAKNRIAETFKDKKYEIIEEFKGKELVGKKYKPVFDYYSKDEKLKNHENGWKIYSADFVTTGEGTGVVHIAPAFGEDDMNLGKEKNLPFVQHVGMDGVIRKEAGEFSGMNVKPEGDTQKTDVEIIKYLAKNNTLFSKEKYEHSYPHCWRCETPLINYATTSWFVSILRFKERMIELADGINWSPTHIKKGRFGNWLEGARDWSISRQRFWASVMPIWKCACGETRVVGSVDEIREGFGNPNKLFLIRHGQSKNNIEHIITTHPKEGKNPLTKKGKEQIEKLAENLENKRIDLIFSSPIQRSKETAEIISKKIKAEIIYDERLLEIEFGKFEGKKESEYLDLYPQLINPEKTDKKGVEGIFEIRNRLESFLKDINEKYEGKNIAILSHGGPLMVLNGMLLGMEDNEILSSSMLKNGEFSESYSKPVDLHKHIVDKITLPCGKCGGEMKRIPDVLDTWFDSGSMPYAQLHYPFENKEKFRHGFPAQFIAEGVDQTRAWFYYLHVIASAIMDSRSFNNVVVNGIVLAEDGKKMSKRLQNYPDPDDVMQKYGADILRYYLLTSPVMQAENLNFKESELKELQRGMFRMLWNSYSFFVLYADIDKFKPTGKFPKSDNLLDQWIISELQALIVDVNKNMETYELTRAARLFPRFIDNLSNWYIRRSRKRFWKSENDNDKNQAYETLHYVLITLSKLLAPFCPFVAEEIYRNLQNPSPVPSGHPLPQAGEEGIVGNADLRSVHLEDFPAADEKLIDDKLNSDMKDLREVISMALQERARNKIKVRQPLKEIIFGNRYKNIFNRVFKTEDSQFWEGVLYDEINVKGGRLDVSMKEDLKLDTKITEGLKLEGIAREIIRHIQEMRKEAGYEVDNRIVVCYKGWSEVFEKFGDLIAKETLASSLSDIKIDSPDLSKEFSIEGQSALLEIKR